MRAGPFASAQEDVVLGQILKNMSAIVIAKTNLLQLGLYLQGTETENPLCRLTINPRNPFFSPPGGSTGGEGALLTLYGSRFGVGIDIGGSIRISQSTMGLCGFKPSASINRREQNCPSFLFTYMHLFFSTERSTSLLGRTRLHRKPRACPICYMSRLIANSQPWNLDPRYAPLP
ncbi:hypothetical protein PDIG_46740 [Penicillium digitatum PHI26]|uniref:Amidase domain-containing protein n=2 Tax=Penicillium digitatum TaxID=36651 RepID=K9FSC3_PEND2|nr:hypothetical protein PDIP_18660 [Penicillium digitatum Pd1]EKV12059.1 hypothetical protein PDIG_46740 [Penicillium digitatum PHI26]EKV20205.1 hypothetical protein PDIP_18660 [Penicillium digitatum Pd1]